MPFHVIISSLRPSFKNITQRQLLKHHVYKIHGILHGQFQKVTFEDNVSETDVLPLRTKTYSINSDSDLGEVLNQMCINLCER